MAIRYSGFRLKGKMGQVTISTVEQSVPLTEVFSHLRCPVNPINGKHFPSEEGDGFYPISERHVCLCGQLLMWSGYDQYGEWLPDEYTIREEPDLFD